MSQAAKEKSLTITCEKNDSHDLEIASRLQLDGFVWVENKIKSPKVLVISNANSLEKSGGADAEIVNIAQHDTNTESSKNAEECPLECDADIENKIITPSDWETVLMVEQRFWKQYGSDVKTESSSKPKYPASQRLTVKDHYQIDHDKRSNRDPSHYKFDYPTSVVLKILFEQKHAGPYHNVLKKGSKSVVIFAEYPKVPWIRGATSRINYCGVAVKVYRLSNDVGRNNEIYKHVQREYTILLRVKQGTWNVPSVIHRMKNVIVTEFIGEDQETAPSISIVPPGHCRDIYQLIVKEMDNWYKTMNLVHGNLSTRNIVVRYYKESSYPYKNIYIPYVLGWSHSVMINHPRALGKLLRDCQFVTNFFKRKEVPVKSTHELFKDITGLDKISSEVLDAMYKKDLWQEKYLTNPNRERQKCYSKKNIGPITHNNS